MLKKAQFLLRFLCAIISLFKEIEHLFEKVLTKEQMFCIIQSSNRCSLDRTDTGRK